MKEKQMIEEELIKLRKVQFIRPTAAQLHRRQYALVSRVQRKEDKRYFKEVQKRKEVLESKLKNFRKKDLSNSIHLLKTPIRVRTRIESKRRLKPTR